MTALVRPRSGMLFAATLCLLALALALKVQRYIGEEPDAPAMAMLRVEHLLSPEGWSRRSTDVFPAGMPLFAAHFTKSGCPETTVTILGRRSELMHYVAGTHDGDVLFVPAGSSRGRAVEMTHHADPDLPRASVHDGAVTKPLPLLAIAPRSRRSACLLPIEK